MASIYYFLGHEQFQPEVLVKHTQLAETVGFDGVFVSEHFNPWVADKGSAGFTFSTLGAVAATTKHLELMTGVVTPLFRYHPAVVAQAAATIDRLSHGRFALGVGTGEPINEVPLGFTYPAYKERSARMQEALTILEALLRGEQVTYKGQYYQVKDVKLYSQPLHKIPILLAAGGEKSAGLAAQYADGVIVSVKDPEETQRTILTPAQKRGKELGKDQLQIVATRWSVFAKGEKQAMQALASWRGLRAPHRNTTTNPQELQQEADTLPHNEILSKYSMVKSPRDYIAIYKPLIELLRADIVVIQTTSDNQEETIEMLGKEVVPVLKGL